MKRSPGLRALSSEHHSALVLARRAASAANGNNITGVWDEVVQRFETELEPHFRREETLLLPALMQTGEAALVQRTLDEHSQMRTLVFQCCHDASNLRSFAELLQSHVRFEERELFVVAQERLKEFSLDEH